MPNFSTGLLCGYRLLFPGEERSELNEYLKGVNRPLLLKFATYFLGLDPSKSKYSDWKELLQMWFRVENIEFANKVWERSEKLEQQYGEISLLSPIASLKLFETVFAFPATEELVLDEVTTERNLFIAYMICVDDVTKNEEIRILPLDNVFPVTLY
jgi:hypothetical protein